MIFSKTADVQQLKLVSGQRRAETARPHSCGSGQERVVLAADLILISRVYFSVLSADQLSANQTQDHPVQTQIKVPLKSLLQFLGFNEVSEQSLKTSH